MREVTIRIPEKLFNRLTEYCPEDLLSGFTNAALEEWVGWLDGSSRPMSISEIESQRIFSMYSNVLAEEIPSSDHVGQFFGLPLGRARYIMQVLNYRHGAFIRERQIRHIVNALRDGESSEDGETYSVKVDKSVKKILDQTISGLVADDQFRSTVSGKVALDHVSYEMGERHRTTLLEVFLTELTEPEE